MGVCSGCGGVGVTVLDAIGGVVAVGACCVDGVCFLFRLCGVLLVRMPGRIKIYRPYKKISTKHTIDI